MSSALPSPSSRPSNDRLFDELRFLCKLCFVEPTPLNIDAFCAFLNQRSSELTGDYLRPLSAYLITPFKHIIENVGKIVEVSKVPISSELLLTKSLKTLGLIFTRLGTISNEVELDTFLTMFSVLIGQQFPSESSSSSSETQPALIPIRITDDLNLALLEALTSLILTTDLVTFTKKMSIDPDFKFKLGYLINLLLKLVSRPNREVQLRSLNLLRLLYLKISFGISDPKTDVFDLKNRDFSEVAVQFTAFTLPSIVSALARLLQICSGGDYFKLHQSVVSSALKLMFLLLKVTFNGKQIFEEGSSDSRDPKSPDLQVQFNLDWFNETTARLSPILTTIVDIFLEHPDLQIRGCLLNLSTSLLLESCSKFRTKFLKILIQAPVAYFDDPEPLKRQCSVFFTSFHDKFRDDPESLDLTNVLHEELYNLLQKLPFMFRNVDLNQDKSSIILDDNLLSALKTASGYFHLLATDGLYQFLLIDQQLFQLFRTLINVAEFDYSGSSKSLHFINKSSSDLLQSSNLFNLFERQLRFLSDNKKLLQAYLDMIRHFATKINDRLFPLIYDHLVQLLHSSDYDPSVLLVGNLILNSLQCSIVQSEPYLRELLHLYQSHLDITLLYSIQDVVQTKAIQSSDQLKPLHSRDLETIVRKPTTYEVSSSKVAKSTSIRYINSQARYILRHCLLLQGTAFCYFLLHSTTHQYIENQFYQKTFCHFLEAYACADDDDDYEIVSIVAKRLLLYLGGKFEYKCSGEEMVPKMILDNIDYLYSEFSVILDYSVLHQADTMYQIDRYSIRTVQVSLDTILRVLRTESDRSQMTLQKMDYLDRLVDQVLNVIKYYSINPRERYGGGLKRLLGVLDGYLRLVEVVYDRVDESNSRKVVEDSTNQEDLEVEEMVKKLEDYVRNCYVLKKQETMGFEDVDFEDDEQKGLENRDLPDEVDDHDQTEQNRKILDSPIIKSRAGAILHHCALILSDQNVEVRILVLQIASRSMRLLREYEDVLLPYVHKLWDPLVARFSTESNHPVILARAYDCLLLASLLCGDFLLSRTSKDILPKLATFLEHQLNRRIRYFKEHSKLDYSKSVEYYAEMELLGTLGQLLVNLGLRSRDTWSVISMLLVYVSLKPVPKDLQQAAFESLIIIAKSDAGSVRFYLHRIVELFYDDESVDGCESCRSDRTDLGAESVDGWAKYLIRYQGSLLNDLADYVERC